MANRGRGWRGHWVVNDNDTCIAKTCSTCCEEKPSTEFCGNRALRYGINNICNACKDNTRKRHLQKSTAANKSRTDEQVIYDRDLAYPEGVKTCNRCKKILHLSEYSLNKIAKGGVRSNCKTCSGEYSKNYRSRPGEVEGSSKGQEFTRKYRKSLATRTKEQIRIDRERLRKDGTKKCRGCRESLSFDDFHNEFSAMDGLSARCKPCHSANQSDKRKKKDNKYWVSKGIDLACYVCGTEWDDTFHSDHVIPKSLEGSDDGPNRLPICPTHNGSKWMTPLEIWLRETMPERMDEILDRVTGYGVDYKVPEGLYNGVRVFTDCGGQLQWEKVEAV